MAKQGALTVAIAGTPVHTWYRATRPRTLSASVVPMLAGTALTLHAHFHVFRFVLALLGAVAIQAASNMLNEHYDHVQGLDLTRVRRQDMVVQTGEVGHRTLLWGGIAMMAAGSGCGLVLVFLTGPSLLVLGLLSVLAAYAYTARPIALGYRALGEATVFIFMGPAIVMGAYFVQTGVWSGRAFLLSVPIGMVVTAILHVNNVRDMGDDRANGKRTLANLLGRRIAGYEYVLLTVGSYPVLAALIVTRVLPWPCLIALISLPVALRLSRLLTRESAVLALDRVMVGTARLNLRFGLLITLGLIADAVRQGG